MCDDWVRAEFCGGPGKFDSDGGSDTGLALEGDASGVDGLDDLADQCEAEAAAGRDDAAVGGPEELVEDAGELARVDSDPGVMDQDGDGVWGG